MGVPDSYIICGTPRTGSTMLCDLLAATDVAGAQIGRICSALGVSVPSDVSLQPTLAKMPAAQNRIWSARFRAEAGGR